MGLRFTKLKLAIAAMLAAIPSAPAFDLVLTAVQSGSLTGRAELGNVSLGTQGDWSVFIQTDWRSAVTNRGGGIISIGAQSDTIWSDPAALVLSVNGSSGTEGNFWSDQTFNSTVQLTAQDDANNCATSRYTTGTMAPGTQRVWPLVGEAAVIATPGTQSHGLLIACKDGIVSLYDVDPVNGLQLLDSGPGLTSARVDTTAGTFTTITNKPMVIGDVNLVAVPVVNGVTRRQNWGGPMGQVLVWNGGVLTAQQVDLIVNGADARGVVTLNAARGDRYWPGSQIAGQMEELVAGQHGTVTGTGTSFAATTRPTYEADNVTVSLQAGRLFQYAAPPATTTAVRFWGLRRGPGVTDIQLRLVNDGAAFPAVGGDVVVDWTTVAANVVAGAWTGDLPGVPSGPNLAADLYRVEGRYKKQDGTWSTPKRARGTIAPGDTMVMCGQSIYQQFSELSGGTTNVPAAAIGRMHRHKRFLTINTRARCIATYTSGWARTPTAATYQAAWGDTTFAGLLSQKTGRRAGIANFGLSGTPIGFWLGNNHRWQKVRYCIQQNRPRYFLFNNGHGDSGMTQSERWAALDELLAQVKDAAATAPGGAFDILFMVTPVTCDFNTNLDSVRGYDIAWVDSRALAGEPVYVTTTVLDCLQTVDGTHPPTGAAGMGLMAERNAEAIAFYSGHATGGNGNGGRISAGTWVWVGGTLTVTLPIVGGVTPFTTFGAGSPSGFKLNLDGGASVTPATSTLVGRNVTLTYAVGAAPATVDVSYLAGYPGTTAGGTATTRAQSGTDNAIYDTRTGMLSTSSGMPLMPITAQNKLRLTAA